MEIWRYIPAKVKLKPSLQLGSEKVIVDKELRKPTICKIEAVPEMISFIQKVTKELRNGGYGNNDSFGKLYEEGRDILTRIH